MDEYMLTSSPNLSSICAASTHAYYDPDGRIDYNEDAILQIYSGLAPNLRSVSMWYQIPANSYTWQEALQSRRPAWRGFFRSTGSTETQSRSGQLMELSFEGLSAPTLPQLDMWVCHTDFSELRSLDLCRFGEVESPHAVAAMAVRGGFA